MHEHLVSLTPCFSTVVRREARCQPLQRFSRTSSE